MRGFVVAVSIALCAPAYADDLGLLPVDSELVGSVDVAKLQHSAVWKKYIQPVLDKSDVQKGLAQFKACGIDPPKVITKISFGVKGLDGATPEGLMVVHGVPKAKLVACWGHPTAKDIDIKRDGDVFVATPKDGQPVAFAFADDSTTIAVIGANATVAGARAAIKGNSALKTSQAFMDLYKATNTNDTVWLIANGSAKVFAPMVSAGIKPKALFGSMHMASEISVALRIRLDSSDQAGQVATMLQTQAAQAKSFFDTVNVGNIGADVTITVSASPPKLDMLVKMLGGALGGP